MADPLIRIDGLTKIFGSDPASVIASVRGGISKVDILSQTGHAVALRTIDLSIERAEVFVIMGLSGSGKSTLLRHFNRLVEPTEGRIAVDGIDVTGLNPAELRQFRRRKMAMVFQHFALLPHRRVIDNAAYGLTVQGIAKKERHIKARRWLGAVGLTGYESQYPSQLSGGQRQRVGLARALCTDAEVLLMDEPFSALDPLIRGEMQDQLAELQSRLRKTIVFITHDLDEALRLGDRIAILNDGELIQVGTPAEILLAPTSDHVAAFVRGVNLARALSVAMVMTPPSSPAPPSAAGGMPALAPSARLEEVIAAVLESDSPLPVVDAEGRLCGELSRQTLALALAPGRTQ
jgi:glycine betaine/proline transport system ATP-binding protein